MDNRPKTIKIFLLDGNPTGVRSVELSGWTGKGYVIPRNNVSTILSRNELKVPAVYFLIGENDKGEQQVYIGESGNFVDRVQYHHRNKDFWNTAVCFVSKDDSLNKAYVKYLESVLFKEAKKVGRASIESGKDSFPARLSESDKAEADEFAQYVRMLMPSVGFLFLKELEESTAEVEELWYCKGKGAMAKGFLSTEGFVILQGSTLVKERAPALPSGPHIARLKALENGLIDEQEAFYLVKEALIYSSVSFAAQVVLGRSANGWTEWKNADGKTLDEVKRKSDHD